MSLWPSYIGLRSMIPRHRAHESVTMSRHAIQFGRVAQPQFQMVCERPPAAFGGSPPHGACPSKKAEGQIFSSESDPVRMKTNGREAEEKCASGRRFSSGKDCKFQQIVSRT